MAMSKYFVTTCCVALCACASQPPALVEYHGESYFGKSGQQRSLASSSLHHSVERAASLRQDYIAEHAPVTTVKSSAMHATASMDKATPSITRGVSSIQPIASRDIAPPVIEVTSLAELPEPGSATARYKAAVPVSNLPMELPAREAVSEAPKARSAPSMDATTAQKAGTHTVQAGETLYRVSRTYNISVDELKRANNIQDVTSLSVGARLVIPGAGDNGGTSAARTESASDLPAVSAPPSTLTPMVELASAPVAAPKPVLAAKPAAPADAPVKSTHTASASEVKPVSVSETASVAPAQHAPVAGPSAPFIWPVKGTVVSQFGQKGAGLYNDGINIKTAQGTPVQASADGTVVYADNKLAGYGNLIIVRHETGYLSAYAHTLDILVQKGDQVSQGQVIAHVGTTGDVNSPQLHFGIRQGKTPVNPLTLLDENGKNTVLSAR